MYTLIGFPKPENSKLYSDVFMITPNEKEWEVMQHESYLLDGVRYVLETKGKEGMRLFDAVQDWAIEADPVDVYNVSGAGDTVVAVMAICLSMEMSAVEAAEVANKCAGYVVTQPGTSTIPKNKFLNIVDDLIDQAYGPEGL